LSVISRFGSIPCSAKERERTFDERGNSRCALVVEQFGVAEAGAVVDDRVGEGRSRHAGVSLHRFVADRP
jgi:hypothetical protein